MRMNVNLESSWKSVLAAEFGKPYFPQLTKYVKNAYVSGVIYPAPKNIFNAFALCPFENLKVVILGQDPYHGINQAHGLSFSVPNGMKIPPSLQNIYKEIKSDLGTEIPLDGNLERWANQGVLLLNATLTVEQGKPGSHQGVGWEQFTDAVITSVSNHKEHVVFLLWGNFARSKATLIDPQKHLILQAPHPSPFSAHTGFFGCKHFSTANYYLAKKGISEIIW